MNAAKEMSDLIIASCEKLERPKRPTSGVILAIILVATY